MASYLQNSWKEGNVLFNNALNTWTTQIVRGETCERGNPLLPHGLLFLISSKGSFICIIHRQVNTNHSLCYTSVRALAGMWNSSMGLPWRIDPMTQHTMSEHSYHGVRQHILYSHVCEMSPPTNLKTCPTSLNYTNTIKKTYFLYYYILIYSFYMQG